MLIMKGKEEEVTFCWAHVVFKNGRWRESFVSSYNYEREHGGINGMTQQQRGSWIFKTTNTDTLKQDKKGVSHVGTSFCQSCLEVQQQNDVLYLLVN